MANHDEQTIEDVEHDPRVQAIKSLRLIVQVEILADELDRHSTRVHDFIERVDGYGDDEPG